MTKIIIVIFLFLCLPFIIGSSFIYLKNLNTQLQIETEELRLKVEQQKIPLEEQKEKNINVILNLPSKAKDRVLDSH